MDRKFVLAQAEAMMPLVRRILADVIRASARAREMESQMSLLASCRQSPEYEIRRKYYGAIAAREQAARDLVVAITELESLGVRLLNAEEGLVGYPFRWSRNARSRKVRRAYFLLRLTDDPAKGIGRWRFEGERVERSVPAHWLGQLSLPVFAEMSSKREP